jgi:Phosphotransferase system, mannose/fructose/N-acetylgalactosamine-specific component IID
MKMSNENQEKQGVLTKHDLRKAGYRWLMSVNTFNYEGQLSSSVVFALSQALRKIYKKDDDYVEALNNHYKYFNTHPWIANLVLGAALAMEDKEGIKAKDTIQDFKVGLMGPLAGIGDTIIWILLPTIMGSIAGYMAIKGNPTGMIAWIIMNIFFFIVRTRLFEVGYNQGMKIFTKFSKELTIFTEAASVLGLVVVGALIPSVVTVTCPLSFKTGEVAMKIQPLLDSILPSLIPVTLAFIAYKLLGKKVKMTTLILLIIVISMIGAALGILG